MNNLSYEEKNEFKEMSIRIFKAIIPGLIQELLANELLDRDRVNDKEYVMTTLLENCKKIKLPNIQVATYKTLRETLKCEIVAGREESAIIIAGVCIEHLLNHFYQDILPFKYDMNNKEVASALNSLKIEDKIGWFLNITTNNEVPNDLKGKIVSINKIRNKVVHYKAIPEDLYIDGSGSYNEIKKKLESLNLEQLIKITVELEKFLDKILIENNDDYRLAYDISINIDF